MEKQADVGVIVGRFQVDDLHSAHLDLIQRVCAQHDKVVIFLGMSPVWVTHENPLDFQARSQMILARFPQVMVLYIKDVDSDDLWSQRLDNMIQDVVTPAQSVMLYGGRDSFIGHYTGRFPTKELEQRRWDSATEIRKSIGSKSAKASRLWRAGAIWASRSQYINAIPTVDCAVFDEPQTSIYLGRKPDETQFRLFGGFVDPRRDASLEAAARRETHEESGLNITDPVYVTSYLVDDWRYRHEQPKIMTTVFKAKRLSGAPKPGDDIAEVALFELHALDKTDIVVPSHRPLIAAVIGSFSKYGDSST